MFHYYIYKTVLSPKFSNLRTNFTFLEMRDVMSLVISLQRKDTIVCIRPTREYKVNAKTNTWTQSECKGHREQGTAKSKWRKQQERKNSKKYKYKNNHQNSSFGFNQFFSFSLSVFSHCNRNIWRFINLILFWFRFIIIV